MRLTKKKYLGFRPSAEDISRFNKIFELMRRANPNVDRTDVLQRCIGETYRLFVAPELRKALLERQLTDMAQQNALRQKVLSSEIEALEKEIKKKKGG